MPDTPATDWTRYYKSPFPVARFTRRITGRILANTLAAGGFPAGGSIIELGGGNSAFCDTLRARLHARHYTIVDINPLGVELFREKHPGPDNETISSDIFELDVASIEPADLVLSIGLIEHFPEERRKETVRRHFALAKPGGLVLITFPTPILSYRLVRGAAEALGIWSFPDERPVPMKDAAALCAEHGDVLAKRINRAILLAQGIVLARKPR